MGMDPWLLWGGSQQVAVDANNVTVPQIVNIDYQHPTTWRFFLFVQGLFTEGAPPAAGVAVDFNLQLGVGRSNSRIERFCEFALAPADFTGSSPGYFCTAVNTTDPGAVSAPTRDRRVEVLPAQSIQLNATCVPGPSPGTRWHISLSAYFAPETHIRPDWFAGHFGTELGGK